MSSLQNFLEDALTTADNHSAAMETLTDGFNMPKNGAVASRSELIVLSLK